MKHLTTTLITLSLAILLLGACVPAPAAPASPVASPTAADWQTYTNAEVGFSIEMPSTWSQQTLPDQNDGRLSTGRPSPDRKAASRSTGV